MAAKVSDAPEDLEVRRCVVQTFGVEVIYQVVSEVEVIVLAIFHGSREPGFWLERLLKP